jgi:GT2 family glycosyltransferase
VVRVVITGGGPIIWWTSMTVGSIVIVSHNSVECIECCLAAVLKAKDWKLVLVDNASTDATVEVVRRMAPNSCMLLNSQNMGFASAVNQGIKAADGEIFVILNPDAIPAPSSLDKLAQALSGDDIGAAGGMLTALEGTAQKGFTFRRLPTLASALAEVLLLNRLLPGNRWNRSYRCLDLDYTRLQEVDQPAGACLAIKRKTWEDVGGFDTGFFPVWFEDVDFCRRLRDQGWKIRYCPDAVFVHAGGHSVKKLTFREQQSYWYRNLLRYFGKHHAWWEVLCLRVGIVAGLVLRSLLSLVSAGPPGVSVSEAVAGYWYVIWEYAVMGRVAQRDAKPHVLASPAV